MTDTNHPITPPPELIARWTDNAHLSQPNMGAICHEVATQAARWGADQELEACCEWLETGPYGFSIEATAPSMTKRLRAARRPKPPSLKAEAIEVLDELDGLFELPAGHYNTILRALEKLDDSL